MFQIGTKHQLFIHLGIPYGNILFEDFKPIHVNNLEAAKKTLQEGVDRKILTGEEANDLVRQMTEAGILESQGAVFEQAAKAELPEDFVSSVTFVPHECGLTLPHGSLKNNHTGEVGGAIHTLLEGLMLLDELVAANKLQPLEGVMLFKQMKAMDLPFNDEDGQRRYDELPEDKKRKADDFDMGIMVVDIGGQRGGSGSLLDFLFGKGARDERRSARQG